MNDWLYRLDRSDPAHHGYRATLCANHQAPGECYEHTPEDTSPRCAVCGVHVGDRPRGIDGEFVCVECDD